MFASVLLYLIFSNIPALCIDWSGSNKGGGWKGADIQVPLYANGGKGTISLHIEKYFSGGSAKNCVYLLAGGPGQSSDMWYMDKNSLRALFGSESALIVIEHRGTGSSSPLCSESSTSWKNNFSSFASSAKYPVNAISITNAGNDAVHVANLVKSEESWAAEASQIIVGSSYGTRVAVAAANIAPELWSAVILDGLDMESAANSLAGVTGEEVLENCKKNAFCSRMMGSPASILKTIGAAAKNPSMNACTEKYFEIMKKTIPGANKPCALLEYSFYKTISASQGSDSSNRFVGGMLIVPLLLQFRDCTDVGKTEKISNKIAALTTGDGASIAAGGHEFHEFVHYYISASERWRGSRPSYCSKCSDRIFKVCQVFDTYAQKRKLFGSHLYKPGKPSQSALKASKAKVLIFGGGQDFNTPIKPMKAMVGRMSAASKHHLVFENRGHILLENTRCIKLAIDEVVAGGNKAATDACVAQQNSYTLDWEGQDSGIMRGLFPEDPTGEEKSANKTVKEGGGGSTGMSTMMIIFIVIFIFAIVGGGGAAAYFFYFKPKQE